MACFDNIVALKELCSEVTPDTTLYLNDIGITKELINQILLSDSDTIQDFVDDKIDFVTKLVVNDVYKFFNKTYKANALVTGHRIGETQDNKQLIAGTGMQGIGWQLHNSGSYLKVFINDITLQLNTAETVDVLIYDLKQAKLLHTESITTTAGELTTVNPYIELEAPKRSLDLWIGYDATGIDSIKTLLSGNCQSCNEFTLKNNYISARGSGISAPYIRSSLTNLSHTSGLGFTYSIQCDHESWLCTYINAIALAVLYKVGAEIVWHGMNPAVMQRSNNTTTLNQEKLQTMYDHYEMNYRERMDRLVESISVPYDTACFECNSKYAHMTAPI